MSGDPDLALHALAQLGDHARLAVEATGQDLVRLSRIARAYGVEDRVQFSERARRAEPGPVFSIHGTNRTCPDGSFASVVHALSDVGAAARGRGDDSVLRGARVALVTNRPAHYRHPLFDGMAERLRSVGASFRVYFVAGASGERPWLTDDSGTYDREYLSSVSLPVRRHRRPSVPARLGPVFDGFKPTILLVAGLSPLVAGRLARTARRRRATVGVWSGEIGTASTARGAIRGRLRRALLTDIDFGIVYGWQSARYLRTLAPSLPVVIGRNTSPLPHRRPRRAASRLRLVAVGDLATDRKGMDVLVDAIALLPDLNCELRLIGGGRLLPLLTRRAEDPRIKLFGSRLPAETRAEMAKSDIYLFPTRFDLFGLSLVEAMGCGLPSVVTPYSGAVEDLCVPGLNSIVVGEDGPRAWAEAVSWLASDETARISLGDAAAATIHSRWTIAHAVDAMIAGLRLGALGA